MSRVDDSVSGQRQDFGPQTLAELVKIPGRKISAADASAEQSVACEHIAAFLIVKQDPSFRMSWRLQYFQLYRADVDDVTVFHVPKVFGRLLELIAEIASV